MSQPLGALFARQFILKLRENNFRRGRILVETIEYEHAMAAENAIAYGRGQQEVRRHDLDSATLVFFS